MLALYTSPSSLSEKDTILTTIGEAANIVSQAEEVILTLRNYLLYAHEVLREAGVVHRIPEGDAETILEVLGGLSELRNEMSIQADSVRYGAKKKA